MSGADPHAELRSFIRAAIAAMPDSASARDIAERVRQDSGRTCHHPVVINEIKRMVAGGELPVGRRAGIKKYRRYRGGWWELPDGEYVTASDFPAVRKRETITDDDLADRFEDGSMPRRPHTVTTPPRGATATTMNSADTDRIRKVVTEVSAKIARYRDKPFNEQDTKATLIAPVLEALGWDTRDPESVRHEYRTNSKDNPVDYALLVNRTPKLMVEAKPLGDSLSDRKWVGQVIGYAAVAGAEWCVLTNGDTYRLYNATAAVDAAEKLLCQTTISTDPAEQSAAILALFSRPNVGDVTLATMWKIQHIDRKVRAALQSMFATTDRRLVNAVRTVEPGLSPRDVAESVRRLDVRIEAPRLRMPEPIAKRPPRVKRPVAKPKPVGTPAKPSASESHAESTDGQGGRSMFQGGTPTGGQHTRSLFQGGTST